MSTSVQKTHVYHCPIPHGYSVGSVYKKDFSLELHEISRTAHKTHVKPHHPHGLSSQLMKKKFMTEIQWNVQNYTKLIF